MDVTTVSGASAFQQQKLQYNVQTGVDAKILDIAKNLGAGALQLLQSASLQSGATPPSESVPAATAVDTFA